MPEDKLHGKYWLRLRCLRSRQKLLGNIAATFLAIALVAMADGLIAGMRAGSTRLEMLPGQQLAISGPAATKNPLPSDVVATFKPDGCPLKFQLEGFFTGYWFGSGMWRGLVEASAETESASCLLSVAFRGMPAKSAQHYEIHLFENAQAMREASLSIIQRLIGVAPFSLAASCAAAGLILGLATYILGRVYVSGLRSLRLAALYSPALDGASFLCVALEKDFETGKFTYPVFDESGREIGQASALGWSKGKWRLAMRDGAIPPAGALIGTAAFLARKAQDND